MSTHHSTALRRLLRHHLSATHLAGYSVASLLGLVIILTALQFFADVSSRQSSPLATGDFLVVSPAVQGLQTSPRGFTAAEVDSLAAQPWVKRVGEFTQSQFQVMASAGGSTPFSTYLFLESVPDGFLDVTPREWQDYDPATAEFVPIILSRDFLTLYNYGFATSQGLPQLSEQLAATLPLSLTLSARDGRRDRLTAYVVGFSSRINTVAVPPAFMQWAAERYSPEAAGALPSRLILEVTSPGDPAIAAYLRAHSLQADGDKEGARRAWRMLTAITSLTLAVGLVISALALAILMLSLSLLLSRSRTALHRLMELGYTPSALAAVYSRICLALNTLICTVALGLALAARSLWLPAIGPDAPLPWQAVAAALVADLLLSAANSLFLHHRTLRYFRHDS